MGVTLYQAAKRYGWDEGTPTRYLNSTWQIPPAWSAILEALLMLLLVDHSLAVSFCAVPFCRQTPLSLKALRAKDYSENPQTLGEPLKKRRRQLGLLQRETAAQMGVLTETYANWEKDKTKPVASQFRPVVALLGYDPTPAPQSLKERFEARRRALGMTFSQAACIWAGIRAASPDT
jgi:transcriptional regulator with XRE-family HTH domain